ncbi:MAG TPA: DUF721 domain-containing protein [Polyangia bacterium]
MATQTLAQLGRGPEYLEQRALLCWPDVVGPRVAARAQAHRLQRGVLTVRVDGAAWLSELTYLKADIRDRMNDRLGGHPIVELRLVPGTITPRAAEPERLVPAPAQREPLPAEIAEAEAAAAHIPDPELRAAVVACRLSAYRRQPPPAPRR